LYRRLRFGAPGLSPAAANAVGATCEPMNPNARVVRWMIAKPSFDWRLQLAWVQHEYGK
jgi:hypothetical protein